MSDFYNIDSALSEEERAVRDTMRVSVTKGHADHRQT